LFIFPVIMKNLFKREYQGMVFTVKSFFLIVVFDPGVPVWLWEFISQIMIITYISKISFQQNLF